MKLYLVGGFVRDAHFGKMGKDLDFAVEAPDYETMRTELKARGAEFYVERPEFVTLRGRIPREAFPAFGGRVYLPHDQKYIDADFTLCRAEAMYHDNRHPSVVTPTDIFGDLSRRDFTINAIAISEDGVLVDPYWGARACRSRALITVGDADARFTEDPLRILRGLRFVSRYQLHIVTTCRLAMEQQAHLLKGLPVERVRDELHKMMKHDWHKTMTMLEQFPTVRLTLYSCFPTLWFEPTTKEK